MPTSIKTGGGSAKFEGTATTDQVLSGATFYSSDKEIKTGGMPNNGAVSQALNCGGSYTIPKGYHNGSGKVTANTLASQTSGTATASQILSGKTAWVNGSKVTGTIPTEIGDVHTTHKVTSEITYGNYSNNTGNYLYFRVPQYAYTGDVAWYLSPASTVASTLGITANKIASGNTICGVVGSYVGASMVYIGSTTLSASSKSGTITFSTSYDYNKIAVFGARGGGASSDTLHSFTVTRASGTITITKSDTSYSLTVYAYYFPTASSVKLHQYVGTGGNITTSKSPSGSFLLYTNPFMGTSGSYVGTFYISRSGTTTTIGLNGPYKAGICISEVVL